MQKVISLIASSTEIVCALGMEECLIGRSHECDFPLTVKQLPICTSPKFNPDGTSYQIDQRVKAILQEGLSVYRVDAELLKKLRPDIIITQTQCEVCAVSYKDVELAVCQFLDYKPTIVALEPNELNDVWSDITRVARALNIEKKGKALVAQCQNKMQTIFQQTKIQKQKPTVACIEWIEPLMAAGNWMPTIVHQAGGINLFGQEGKHSPWMKWEELVHKNPDIILVLPCGFSIPKSISEMPILQEKVEWNQLRAVKNEQVYILDGNQYFNRPGPRLVESLEILSEIFYPKQFNFGHKNNGWQKLSN